MADLLFTVDDFALYTRICGVHDEHLKVIASELGVELIPRGNNVLIRGTDEEAARAERLLHAISDYMHDRAHDYSFEKFELKYLAGMAKAGRELKINDFSRLKIVIPDTKKSVFPRTANQVMYLSEIQEKAIVFGIGPAGTGKTYLAVAAALKELYAGRVSRIVLTRPAVEAGESLGFLPGDFVAKINPYLRPLYDALFDLAPFEKISNLMENNIIEIAPLAYMRGRTLSNAFVILDEAQNTTFSQMKMFLTRLGNSSKMVISGDVTQIDIDKPSQSGLVAAKKILSSIKEIGFVEFLAEDICRHPIVEKIINAYDRYTPQH